MQPPEIKLLITMGIFAYMPKIKSLKARQVFDSRGNATVEAELQTESGTFTAIVPSGASVGKHEALELRDHDGSVKTAVANVNRTIAPKLRGKDCSDQKKIDELLISLDGTANKSRLGANAILSVSIACCRAGAEGTQLYKYISQIAKTKPKMPIPLINVINGGKHADDFLDIQEYMFVPFAKSFSKTMQMSAELFHKIAEDITIIYGRNTTNVGDEGGFAPPIKDAEGPLELIQKAVHELGYEKETKLALDIAASSLWKKNHYELEHKHYSAGELEVYYEHLINHYPLFSIEDPFHEEAWQSFSMLTKAVGKETLIVGDDLLASNPARIQTAIEKKACNSLLLKLNQIGTVSEAISAFNLAKKANWEVIVSHRSGETEDSFIADFAVGLGSGYCKFGGLSRSERLSKYNQLLRIEEEL